MEYVLLALAAQFVVPGLTLLAAAAAGYFTARSLGIRGVPCFVFDRRFAVSGAQPSELLVQALRQAAVERYDEAVTALPT